MPTKLPLDTDNENRAFLFELPIEDVSYLWRFRYLDRADSWYFDVLADDGEILAPGIRVVANWPLTRRFPNPRLFGGLLICFSVTGAPGDPGRDNFGGTGGDFVMFHYTADEILADFPPPSDPTLSIVGPL